MVRTSMLASNATRRKKYSKPTKQLCSTFARMVEKFDGDWKTVDTDAETGPWTLSTHPDKISPLVPGFRGAWVQTIEQMKDEVIKAKTKTLKEVTLKLDCQCGGFADGSKWQIGMSLGKLSWARFSSFASGKLGDSEVAAGFTKIIEEVAAVRSDYTDTATCIGKAIDAEVDASATKVISEAATTYLSGMFVTIITETKDKMEKRNAVNEELKLIGKLSLTEAIFHKTLIEAIGKAKSCA